MAGLVDNFVTQWSNEVNQSYQQMGSVLRNTIRNVTGVIAGTYKFHRLLDDDSVSTQSGTADFTLLDPTKDTRTATLEDKSALILVKNLEEVKTNADFRREYVVYQANKLGRITDDIIIDAALASTGLQTIPTTAGGLTVAKIKEAKYALDVADVPNKDRYFVLDAASLQSLLGDSNVAQIASNDYNNVKALVNGEIDTFMGFKFIRTSRVPNDGSPSFIHTCFAYHKDSVGLAVGKDVSTTIDWDAMKRGHVVGSDMSLGAVRIFDEGVVAVPADLAV